MVIFIGILTYAISKYKLFDIKLLSAQALVAALVILIGAQFFSLESEADLIITTITFILVIIFGIFLIKSVKLEIQRKEQLQEVSDKLSLANDQLRTLDNAKSEFISIASHQLRTPLTAVKGYISLLLEGSYGKVDKAQKDVLQKVYQANERLVNLVEDMLNLSRIESGRMEYDFAKVKIEDVCQEVYDTFVIRAKEHNLSLALLFPENLLPEAMTDKNKIREVISNLVDNALKYTPEGGVKVILTDEGESIRVAVKDTGIGVPQEEMPYLFAKFSRGKNTARLNAVGTGLGLHVGKRMMDDLHGKIWVESEGAGKGSTFFVEIPMEIKEK
jgi:signal transduction histidine kinase